MKNNNNSNIKIIKTRKYKDISLYLRFSIYNQPKAKEIVYLLSKFIGLTSKQYNSKDKMQKAKDMLYGISVDASDKCKDGICTLAVSYSFINPKFVDVTIDDYAAFIKETLFNPLIDEKNLNEIKRICTSSIYRRLEKPAVYASQRVMSILAKDDDSFSIYLKDEEFIKTINSLTVSDLTSFYEYLLKKAQLCIYLCGDVNKNDIAKLTDYSFKSRNKVKIKQHALALKPKKDIIENHASNQSILYMFYTTPFTKKHKDYFAWFLGNAMFGSLPTSLLFSVIREKLSLCYSISTSDFKNSGLVSVTTFIDDDKKDTVVENVNKQLQRLIDGDFDLALLKTSKKLICNSIMSIYDDIDALVDYYFESNLSNFNYTIEQYRKLVNSVTKQDIQRVFKKYKPYFVYMLKGNKDEKEL